MDPICKQLQEIQAKLKAPKNQYNNFGKYTYRSLEDITEAVKPLLAEAGLAFVMDDDIVLIGDRHYVKATVRIVGGEAAEPGSKSVPSLSASAYAREPLVRKGMDESQITGAASSYARKYAMNGLFAIDDTKDADSSDNSKLNGAPKPQTKAPPKDDNPEPEINEIVEMAFNEFKVFYKDALPDGFHYSLPIFYNVVEQKYGHLPSPKADKAKSVAHIIKTITPKEILEQDKCAGCKNSHIE